MIELEATLNISEDLHASLDGDLRTLDADMGNAVVAGVKSWNGQTGDVTYTAPVSSVNGQTGAVTISVPTKTSELQNDSGFITDAGVTSFNGQTGDVTYTAPTYTLNKQTANVIGANASMKSTIVGGGESVATGVSSTSKKLVTTSVPNVTDAGSASTWAITYSNDTVERLTISGGNGTAPTLGTDITVATGSVDDNGTGDTVVTSASASGSVTALTPGTLVNVQWNNKDQQTVLTNSTDIQ